MTIKRFLAIAFMCHQRPDRSFFVKGKQFPLCARCTGILVGYLIGVFIASLTKSNNYIILVFLLLPMVIDGVLQLKFEIESNNIRRFVTGVLGGVGIIYTFISIHFFTCWWVRLFLIHIGII